MKDQLRRRGIEVQDHASKPDEIRINCPFCPDRGKSVDTEFKLGINTKTGRAHCFRCDYASKNVARALNRKLSVELSEKRVATKQKLEEPEEIEAPENSLLLAKDWNDSNWTRKAKEYLESRKVDLLTMHDKLVIFTYVGPYSHRIIFPVVAKEKLVGLVCRALLDGQKPRYLNTPGPKAIWNIPGGSHRSIILCEGIFKALAIERIIEDENFSVGALHGHSISEYQISQLGGVKHVILFPDPDPVGLEGAITMAYKLKNKFKVYLPVIIPEKQADELTEKEAEIVINSFRPFTESFACRYRFIAMKRKSYSLE